MGMLAIFAIVAVLIVYIKTTNKPSKSPSATTAKTNTSYTATIPPNELLAYRQGGPLWIHYYAKQSTTHNESRVLVCLHIAELIKKCFDGNCTEVHLNRPGASLQYITLAYMHDKVQLICHFNAPNSEYSFLRLIVKSIKHALIAAIHIALFLMKKIDVGCIKQHFLI